MICIQSRKSGTVDPRHALWDSFQPGFLLLLLLRGGGCDRWRRRKPTILPPLDPPPSCVFEAAGGVSLATALFLPPRTHFPTLASTVNPTLLPKPKKAAAATWKQGGKGGGGE